MVLFTLLLFPACFFIITSGCSCLVLPINRKIIRFLACIGFIAGVLVCTIDGLFVSPVFFPQYSLSSCFVRLIIEELLIPFAVCLVPYMLCFKEDILFKLKTLVFVLFGFYAVYMPYRIISRYEILSPFTLFAKPVLYLSFFIALQYLFSILVTLLAKPNKAAGVALIVFILGFLCIPSFIETIWFLGLPIFIWLSVFVVFLGFSVLLVPFCARSMTKKV